MTKHTAATVRAELASLGTPDRATGAARFFKTGKGDYGEGDVFLGVSVPQQRMVARAYRELPLPQIAALLRSKIHEERLTALFVLVHHYARGDEDARERAIALYLDNLDRVNNWDLVDSSAFQLLGAHLLERDRRTLRTMARSENLWERRIAIIATHAFVRRGESKDALAIAALLLNDEHDLIHKAVGWTLREVGERVGMDELRTFLGAHAATMPRTALRYALEKMPPEERRRWMTAGRAR